LQLLFLSIVGHLPTTIAKNNGKSAVIDNIQDMKDLKKLLRTKTNVMLLFVGGAKEASKEIKIFREAATTTKGLATMVLLDCSNK
jgi:deoxyhypusine synthase